MEIPHQFIFQSIIIAITQNKICHFGDLWLYCYPCLTLYCISLAATEVGWEISIVFLLVLISHQPADELSALSNVILWGYI